MKKNKLAPVYHKTPSMMWYIYDEFTRGTRVATVVTKHPHLDYINGPKHVLVRLSLRDVEATNQLNWQHARSCSRMEEQYEAEITVKYIYNTGRGSRGSS
jgi:hypothetical protein